MDQMYIVLLFVFALLVQILINKLIIKQIKYAQLLSIVSVFLISITISVLNMLYFSVFSIFYSIFAIFMIINLARVAVQRMNPNELKEKFRRSFYWLSSISFVFLLLALSKPEISILIIIMLVLSFIGSFLLFVSTIYSAFRWRPKNNVIENQKMPTVSICIPARNETQDLPECIESMIDSNYPKLEIIVLDDCSHDKTPAVIKEYAHKGVRFIKGTEPDEDWLAKNQAMNKLFDESTGDIIIFAGVDVRFNKNTVNNIVSLLQNGNKMVSVLPKRSSLHEMSLFIQPLRYWWELSVPRFIGGRPPVLSTCWAIKRDTLKSLGEFDSYRKSVQPEAHFAKKIRDSFTFIIAGNTLDVESVKAPREQYDTAIRTRYPQLKRRLELVPVLLLLEIIIFFTPLIGIINYLIEPNGFVLLASLASISFILFINAYISFITVYRTWIFGFINIPFLLFEEWFILIRSTLAYEFGVVIWKDRNICLPMYKVEKSLPKLD